MMSEVSTNLLCMLLFHLFDLFLSSPVCWSIADEYLRSGRNELGCLHSHGSIAVINHPSRILSASVASIVDEASRRSVAACCVDRKIFLRCYYVLASSVSGIGEIFIAADVSDVGRDGIAGVQILRGV